MVVMVVVVVVVVEEAVEMQTSLQSVVNLILRYKVERSDILDGVKFNLENGMNRMLLNGEKCKALNWRDSGVQWIKDGEWSGVELK